jgi:hypothetical protein
MSRLFPMLTSFFFPSPPAAPEPDTEAGRVRLCPCGQLHFGSMPNWCSCYRRSCTTCDTFHVVIFAED